MLHFLQTYHNDLAFILCGLVGGLTHYLKKSLKGETTAKLWQWFGPANAESTIYTLIVFTFVMIGALASGIITPGMTIWAVFYSGFITGYAVDSGVNSNPMQLTSDINQVKTDADNLLKK